MVLTLAIALCVTLVLTAVGPMRVHCVNRLAIALCVTLVLTAVPCASD